MEEQDIARGWTVFSEDGKRVGDVVEVHPHYLLVSRGLFVVRDLFVPRYAVASAGDRKVRLAITEDRLKHMGWTAPPPPPPPDVDTASPRLVPTYAPDEPDFGDAAPQAAAPEAGENPDLSYLTDMYAAPTDEYGEETFDDYGDMGITFGPTIEVDDAYLAVQRLGEGPAVVLAHGWGLDRRVWDYLALDLTRDHTVVTYDARGYGGSSRPWQGYDVGQASRDLRVVLRTLELEDATIVTLDAAAAAALHYVFSGGRRAGRLILIAPVIATRDDDSAALPGPSGLSSLPEPLDAWQAELRHDRPRLATRLAALWAPQASAETQAWLRDGLLAAAPHALLDGLATLAGTDVEGDLAAVTIPVLALQGRDDPLAALTRGRQIADAIQGARLVEVDIPGHLPMLSDPQRIAAEIRAFIAEQQDETPTPDAAGEHESPGVQAEATTGWPSDESEATMPGAPGESEEDHS